MKKTILLLTALLTAAVFAQDFFGRPGINTILDQADADLLADDDTGAPTDPVHVPGDPAADSTSRPIAAEPHSGGSNAQTQVEPATEPPPAGNITQTQIEPVPPPPQPALTAAPAAAPAAPPAAEPAVQEELSAEPGKKAKPEAPRIYVRSPLSSAWVFPAGYVSYSTRDGYRKYDGVEEYQHFPCDGMFMYGGAAGKRFALKNPRLRIQTTLEIGWGSSKEYEALLEIGAGFITIYQYIHFFTYGTQTDMHVLFPTQNINRKLFISFGAGVHKSEFYHTLETKDGEEIAASNEMSIASISANIGVGVERKLNRQRAISFSYNLRFWRPIAYNDVGDMFPMGAEYEEFFYSHALQVQILLPARWGIGFR